VIDVRDGEAASQSLRRFNDSPFALPHDAERAARTPPTPRPPRSSSFDLAYRPPYDWEAMLDFLRKRAVKGAEAVEGRAYLRTVRVERHGKTHRLDLGHAGAQAPGAARDDSASLAGALPVVLARVKHLFDLACRPRRDRRALGPLARDHPGLRAGRRRRVRDRGARDPRPAGSRCQSARTIAGRLFVEAFGTPIATPHAGAHASLSRARDGGGARAPGGRGAGINRGPRPRHRRARRGDGGGAAAPRPRREVTATVAALEALPGVGPWTAQYIAMRALAWPDAFPHPTSRC